MEREELIKPCKVGVKLRSGLWMVSE